MQLKASSPLTRFPVLLKEPFGNLPEGFGQGFDGFVSHGVYGRA